MSNMYFLFNFHRAVPLNTGVALSFLLVFHYAHFPLLPHANLLQSLTQRRSAVNKQEICRPPRSLTEGAQSMHFRDLQPNCLLLIIYYAAFMKSQLRINSKDTTKWGKQYVQLLKKSRFPSPKSPIPPETSTGVQPITPSPCPSRKPCRGTPVTTICLRLPRKPRPH